MEHYLVLRGGAPEEVMQRYPLGFLLSEHEREKWMESKLQWIESSLAAKFRDGYLPVDHQFGHVTGRFLGSSDYIILCNQPLKRELTNEQLLAESDRRIRDKRALMTWLAQGSDPDAECLMMCLQRRD